MEKSKISAIILAAGNSLRFGKKKLLQDFQGKPLVMHVIEEAMKVDFEEIIVVTQYKEIEEMLDIHKIHMVYNQDVGKGISHSIYLGINEGKNCDGYMFIVGDQPFVTSEIMKGMIDRFNTASRQILCMSYQGITGSPTLFDICYKEELLGLQGDVGGKQVIKRHPEHIEAYEVENLLMLEDIDTLEDYERLIMEKRIK